MKVNNRNFRNLVFEGGGVKGIAYIGAMEELERRKVLAGIRRVGGTSAGAINACLFALRYSVDEQRKILNDLDFNRFEDTTYALRLKELSIKEKLLNWQGYLTVAGALLNLWLRKGLHRGTYFENWISELIEKKVGKKDASFQEVFDATGIELHICAANVSTKLAEVFSHRDTPSFSVAKAVRISMSIPFFFEPIEIVDAKGRKNIYVDGGVFRNYPVRLFDHERFIEDPSAACKAMSFELSSRKDNDWICNAETLGFRLDSKNEIDVFRDGKVREPEDLRDTVAFFRSVIGSLLVVQENSHLSSEDWERTIYIDTLGVDTTDFDISEKAKLALIESGRIGVVEYFDPAPTNVMPLIPVPRMPEAGSGGIESDLT